MAVSLGLIGTSDGLTYETNFDLHTGNHIGKSEKSIGEGTRSSTDTQMELNELRSRIPGPTNVEPLPGTPLTPDNEHQLNPEVFQGNKRIAGDFPGRWRDEINTAPVIDYDHGRLQSLKSNQKKFLEDGHLGIQDKGEYFRMKLPEPRKRSAQLSDAGYNDIVSDAPAPVHDALRTLREHFVPTPNKDEPIQNQLIGALGTALLGLPAGPGPKSVPNPRQGFTDEFNTQTSRTQAAIDRLKTESAPFSNRSESQQDGTSMGQMIEAVQRPFPHEYTGEWMQPGFTGIVGKSGVTTRGNLVEELMSGRTPYAGNENIPADVRAKLETRDPNKGLLKREHMTASEKYDAAVVEQAPKALEDALTSHARGTASSKEVRKIFNAHGWKVDLRRGKYDYEVVSPSGQVHYITP